MGKYAVVVVVSVLTVSPWNKGFQQHYTFHIGHVLQQPNGTSGVAWWPWVEVCRDSPPFKPSPAQPSLPSLTPVRGAHRHRGSRFLGQVFYHSVTGFPAGCHMDGLELILQGYVSWGNGSTTSEISAGLHVPNSLRSKCVNGPCIDV